MSLDSAGMRLLSLGSRFRSAGRWLFSAVLTLSWLLQCPRAGAHRTTAFLGDRSALTRLGARRSAVPCLVLSGPGCRGLRVFCAFLKIRAVFLLV